MSEFNSMNTQSCLEDGRSKLVAMPADEAGEGPAPGTCLPGRILFAGSPSLRKLVALAVVFAAFSWTALPLAGQLVTNSFEFSGLSLAIPDTEGANYSGVQDTREIAMGYGFVQNVSVTLDIQGTGSGAFNGDFYAYLTKGDNLAVLLNRPGRTSENLSGYGDNGLNVRFDDNALNGDIHVYRLSLSGDHHKPLEFGEQLTGSWAPDGRFVHPALALDTDPRTHTLATFKGADPNGEWTLFVADMEPGGAGVLVSWSMEIAAVPEPRTMLMFLFGLMAIALWRRKRP